MADILVNGMPLESWLEKNEPKPPTRPEGFDPSVDCCLECAYPDYALKLHLWLSGSS